MIIYNKKYTKYIFFFIIIYYFKKIKIYLIPGGNKPVFLTSHLLQHRMCPRLLRYTPSVSST